MKPFRVEVPDGVLVELRERLGRTRWPALVDGVGRERAPSRGSRGS